MKKKMLHVMQWIDQEGKMDYKNVVIDIILMVSIAIQVVYICTIVQSK